MFNLLLNITKHVPVVVLNSWNSTPPISRLTACVCVFWQSSFVSLCHFCSVCPRPPSNTEHLSFPPSILLSLQSVCLSVHLHISDSSSSCLGAVIFDLLTVGFSWMMRKWSLLFHRPPLCMFVCCCACKDGFPVISLVSVSPCLCLCCFAESHICSERWDDEP